jgi:hypothetical protein
MDQSKCDQCGETIQHMDVGFSPGLHGMKHDCGGTWHLVPEPDDAPDSERTQHADHLMEQAKDRRERG